MSLVPVNFCHHGALGAQHNLRAQPRNGVESDGVMSLYLYTFVTTRLRKPAVAKKYLFDAASFHASYKKIKDANVWCVSYSKIHAVK